MGPQARRAADDGGGGGYGRGEVWWGQLGANSPPMGVFLLQGAHGMGGVSERAGGSASRTTAPWCWPNFRPKSSAVVSAGQHHHWLLHFRPSRDHRRASPPFYSDELRAPLWDRCFWDGPWFVQSPKITIGKAGCETHHLAPTNVASYANGTTWGQRAKPVKSGAPVPRTEETAETNLEIKHL